MTTTVLIVPPPDTAVIDATDFQRAAAIPDPEPAAPAQTATTPLALAIPDPMRVYVVGDSTGSLIGLGLHDWGKRTGMAVVKQGARPACGLLRGAKLRAGPHELPQILLARCDSWPERWPLEIVGTTPDVILVVMGPANTADALLPGDVQRRGLGDPAVDAVLWREMNAAADLLETAGVPVLWFDSPYLAAGAEDRVGTQADPRRIDRYNGFVQRLADTRDLVARVPWAQIVAQLNEGDTSLRPDGVHVEPDRFGNVLDGGLWSELVKQLLLVHASTDGDGDGVT